MGWIDAQCLGDLDRDAGDALDTLELRAEAVVIDHARQTGNARGQRMAAVLVEEEARIGQPRPYHARIAADDGAGIGGLDVRDQQEAVQQPASRAFQREVLLVLLHGQDQALGRHVEERLLEPRLVDHRPFDQRGHFLQQVCRHQRLRAALRGGRGHQLGDALLARVERDDDLGVVTHLLRIAVSRADREFARRMEAVAKGAVTGGQPKCAHRNHVASVQRHQPVGRPRKLHGRVAIGELVAHHLGDRQSRQRLVERGLQARLQRTAGGHAGQEHRLGLAVLFQHQPVGAGGCVSVIGGPRPAIGQRLATDRCQPLAQRGRRLAGVVERDRARHQLLTERLVRCGSAHLADVHGEPARRTVGGGLR